MSELKDAIRQLAFDEGYVACGVTSAEPFSEFALALDDRIARFPGCRSHYDELRRTVDPCATTPWCRSVIVCVRWYGKYRLVGDTHRFIGRNYLFDRRNPRCPDYAGHKRFKERLKGLGLRVKPGGVPERWAAVRAGVGRFGRNCFVYAGRYGSWINVESWRVDTEIEPDRPTPELACPPGCRRCIDACPTGALVAPLRMCYDRCVAYLTYSAPEPIRPEMWHRMGCWIYGCDRCQLVCPLNREAWQQREPAPWLEELAPYLEPSALATMSEQTYRSLIHPAFWYVDADNPERWRRNAERAVGCRPEAL